MADVVFYEAFEEEARLIAALMPPDISFEMTPDTIQESGHSTCPSQLISVRTQSVIPAEWGKRLKGVLSRSTGYDHVLAHRKTAAADVQLGYLPNYCSRAVAEQAAMMMLCLLRKTKLQQKNFESFHRDGLTGKESRGRNLLVVGVGRIGSQVADIGRGLRMNVKGVDLAPRLPDLDYVRLDDGLAWADVTVCALPLTAKTRGLLGYERLSRARRDSLFINIARGEISPLEDLARLLEEKRLAGVGLDVYDDEPSLAASLRQGAADVRTDKVLAFARRENVILTPHNAFNTEEAVREKAQESVRAVERFIKTGTFPDTVPEE